MGAFSARDCQIRTLGGFMRVLFGIILGVALTVGAAFIADSWGTDRATTNGSSSTAIEHRKMVNWDVVGDNMRVARERMRETWTKISHKIAS
jgi:hypothetical protein